MTISLLVPESAEHKRASKKRGRAARKKARKGGGGGGHHNHYSDSSVADDGSISVVHDSEMEDEDDDTLVGGFEDKDDIPDLETYRGWQAKYKFPLRSIEIKSTNRRHVVVTCEHRGVDHSRHLIFDTELQAQNFATLIEDHKRDDERRLNKKMRHALGGIKLPSGEIVTLLVEIVSGTDLPIADRTSSDPFVICFVNGKEVHRTDHISKS